MANRGLTADIGQGMKINWNSDDYYVIDVEGLDDETDDIDTTTSNNESSDNGRKTFIPGLTDPGEITMTILHDPDNPLKADRTVRTLTATFPLPSGQSTAATAASDAYIKSSSKSVPHDDRMEQTVTFKLSGDTTWTASS